MATEQIIRAVMTGGTECVGENDSIVEATKKLAQLNVGLSICGEDERVNGMLTEHDIVARVLVLGQDPAQTRAGNTSYGKPVTIGAEDTLQDALKTMIDHNVRRLPVIDGRQLVGHERGSLGHEWRRRSAPCRHLQQLRLGGRLLV
jgi:signal-transduction protein with cAMP-binding, CBS, and nucleotidyltransferase domain